MLSPDMKTILRPSFLVKYEISAIGGKAIKHSNRKEEMQAESEISEWQSNKVIFNKEAFDEANRLRSSLNYLLRGRSKEQKNEVEDNGPICFDTVLGLLCPFENETRLNEAARAIQLRVKAYNDKWRKTRGAPTMKFFLMKANFLCTAIDTEQVIIKNITEMLEMAEESTKNGNIQEAQQYLSQLRGLQNLFGTEMMVRFAEAIREGKKNKNELSRKLKKGESVASVASALDFSALRQIRDEFVAMYPDNPLEGENRDSSLFYTANVRQYEDTIEKPLDNQTKIINIDDGVVIRSITDEEENN